MRRRFFPPASPVLRPPLHPTEGGDALPAIGATIRPESVPTVGQQTPRDRRLPMPFDLVNITAVPASGTRDYPLIGTDATNTPRLATTPDGYRGVVDGIFPYLEGAGGVVSQARIPGNVTIRWRIRLNSVPVPTYGALEYILAPWNGQSDRVLLELPPGQELSVVADYTDAFGVYSYIGIRIKGRFLPWSEDLNA